MLAILFISPLLLGFYLAYITSKQAVLDVNIHKYELYLLKKTPFLRYISIGFILTSVVLIIPFWGPINGFILWFLTSMLVLSFLVIMTPLKLFNFKVMGGVIVLCSIVIYLY